MEDDDIEDLANEDKITGFVHSIDSFTAVDGAGIRCIFFLQSCHKRCVFCCNVDSTDAALARADASTPTPLGRRMRVRECVDIVRRNLDYYKASGGGVTLSGGECLLQPEFARAVCRGVRALGVSASIDTAGAGTDKEWNRVLPHVDCVLLCLKSAFVDRYVAITGTSVEEFELSRRFLRACEAHGTPTWLRFVLMTNPRNDERFAAYATDSEEELVELARVAKSHACVLGIELLPYHRLGVFKFQELELDYALEGMATPTGEDIERAKSILTSQGVRVMC